MKIVTDSSNYKNIANQINIHLGTRKYYKPSEMANAIKSIPTIKDSTPGTATSTDILSGKTAWVNGKKIIGTGSIRSITIDKSLMDKYIKPLTGTITVSNLPAPYTATTKLNNDGTVLCEIKGQDATIYSINGDIIFIPSQTKFNFDSYNANKIFLKNIDTIKVTDMNRMFNDCRSLTTLDISNFNTSNVTTMFSMFNCRNLTSIDVSHLNTSNVTDMNNMFNDCKFTTLDISSFDTSNVDNMSFMFMNCTKLTSLDLSNFDTSRVYSMRDMFHNCESLTTLDLSSFDTSKVFDMHRMFKYCSSLKFIDLSNLNTSKVTDMSEMFNFCSSLTTLDLSSFDTSSVTDVDDIFYGCTSLKTVYCRSQADINNLDINTPGNINFVIKQ